MDYREYLGVTVANQRFERIHFDTKFTGSTFSSVVFDRCRLDRVLMAKTNWHGCDFDGSYLVVSFNDATFNECSFRNSTFKGLMCQFGGVRATFSNCDFSGSKFNRVCLRACRFKDCSFEGTTFVDCDLRGARHNDEPMENSPNTIVPADPDPRERGSGPLNSDR